MPNHVHMIVVIDGGKVPHVDTMVIQDGVHTVSTNARWKDPKEVNEFMREISKRKGWLSVAIGGMKRAVTRLGHSLGR